MYHIASTACNWDFKEVNGIVRARVINAGMRMTKIDNNSCKVVYLTNVDPAGMIPDLIKNQVAKKQGETVIKIE